MVSSGSPRFVLWDDRPARPFPAKVWLEARFPFRVPLAALSHRPVGAAREAERPESAAPGQRRRFPALVWLEEQQRRAANQEGS